MDGRASHVCPAGRRSRYGPPLSPEKPPISGVLPELREHPRDSCGFQPDGRNALQMDAGTELWKGECAFGTEFPRECGGGVASRGSGE